MLQFVGQALLVISLSEELVIGTQARCHDLRNLGTTTLRVCTEARSKRVTFRQLEETGPQQISSSEVLLPFPGGTQAAPRNR